MKATAAIARYNKSGTKAYIQVEELARLICLGIKKLQWAAKPSEVFTKKKNHDEIFTNETPKFYKDIILTSNSLKAMNYILKQIAAAKDYPFKEYSNEQYIMINLLKRPIIKAYLQYIGLAYFYQNKSFADLRDLYSDMLWKAARPGTG